MPNFTRGKIDGRARRYPASGRDEIRLEVSKPACGTCERASESERRGKREREDGCAVDPIGSARARALFFFVLCSRLHPCVKFLPGILPSSVRSRRSIASFPPSDTLFLPRSPSWPVRLGRTEGSPAPTNRALGAFGSHRIASRRAAPRRGRDSRIPPFRFR